MALINRIGRLFRADFHAVLDRIEEPDVLLKQSVREMEAAIAKDSNRIKSLKDEKEQLIKRCTTLQHSIDQFNDELDVCFTAGNESIARSIIKRKLVCQHQIKHLKQKSAALVESALNLQSQLEENQCLLADIEQKMAFLTEKESPDSLRNASEITDFAIQDEDIEIAFLQEQQRRKAQREAST